MGRMIRRVLGLWVACAAVLLAPPIASAAPGGTADGWRSPAIGHQTLTVRATPGVGGAALRSATLTLGGVLLDVEPFADGTCSVTCPATVELTMNTKQVADGNRELVITVEDVNGVDHTIFTQTLLVDNAPRVNPCRVEEDDPCTITVSVGSGRVSLPQPSPPGPVGPGSTDPSCRSPRLSMRLSQRPLRFRRGVPVLLRNRVYRFSGRLTCRINGRRRGAPRGMAVQMRHRLRAGWTVAKPDIHVRKTGEVVARLAFRSRRVVIFRVRGTGGNVVRVRIPIRVVRRR